MACHTFRAARARTTGFAIGAAILLVGGACSADGTERAEGGNRAAEEDPPTTTSAAPLGEATATAEADAPIEELYVVQGRGATAERSGEGYRVVLHVPDDDVLAFNDRPHRGAAHTSVADFVTQWDSLGFTAVPPNAALTGTATDGTQVDMAVELTDPAWDAASSRLTVTATPIGSDRGTELPERFEELSLFVDSAQNTIQLNLTNLSPVLLMIQSAEPDISTWTSSQSPSIGFDFGEASANGPSLSIGLTNPNPGVEFTGQLLLVGDYDNQWQLTVSWDPGGNPSATLTQLGGSGIALMNTEMQPGQPLELPNLDPDDGQTANYQVLFNQQ